MEPQTLQEAITYFASPANQHEYMVAHRWPDGVTCPRCHSKSVKFSEKHNRWQCSSHHKQRQFTLKTGTIFEDSPLGLDKWLTALWLLVNSKNGVSSWEVSRSLGITQKSAWFVMHRLREILEPVESTKLGGKDSGPVEADESFIGGLAKNMHRDRAKRYAEGHFGKTAVMGILDRDLRKIRAKVVPNVKRETLQAEILENVKYGSKVYTDEAPAYDLLHWRYVHEVVRHVETYARGQVHTNGLENFWSLLKRGLKGTYVAVEPFHLDRYVSEQAFRYNNRKTKDNPLNDSDRFVAALSRVVGKRLMYSTLTGKEGASEAVPF